jgi:hypothetical protein
MKYPDRIDGRWIDSLSDNELIDAENTLKQRFSREEKAEKKRMGDDYSIMRGPEALTSAWSRWSMVSAATRDRGLKARR